MAALLAGGAKYRASPLSRGTLEGAGTLRLADHPRDRQAPVGGQAGGGGLGPRGRPVARRGPRLARAPCSSRDRCTERSHPPRRRGCAVALQPAAALRHPAEPGRDDGRQHRGVQGVQIHARRRSGSGRDHGPLPAPARRVQPGPGLWHRHRPAPGDASVAVGVVVHRCLPERDVAAAGAGRPARAAGALPDGRQGLRAGGRRV